MERLELGDLGPLGSLSDPTRRQLYEHVLSSQGLVGRDDAADSLGIPRQTAAYHLDRLVEEGLLEVEFMRRTGRSGPGAGRPAKLYKGSKQEYEVSLPPRRYALAARILLEAVSSGAVKLAGLKAAARRIGEELGQNGADVALRECGYDPIVEDDEVRFRNCPFHALKEQDQQTVCTLNLGLVRGILAGADDGRSAYLEPSDSYCCVRIRPRG